MPDSWTWHRPRTDCADSVAGLVSALAEQGLVLLDDVAGPDALLRLASSIATVVPHRDSDPTGLTTIADVGGRVPSGFAGFSACALNPHTDRSGIADPPILLMMSCGQPGSSGGECVAIDGKAVYDDLAGSHPRALEALGAPRSTLFGGAAGHLGSVFTRTGDRLILRLRLDELSQFSPEVIHWLPVLRATIDRHAQIFRLNAGQGYILDNYRWLHGRRAFTGQRVMYRAHGNPLPHLGITPGFQPARLPGRITWLLSPWDHLVHAFRVEKIGEVVAEALCEHSATASRLTDQDGRRCLACLLLHGDDLAGRHGEMTTRWGT
ncbi:TauD/TfdA family dioxygenase [Actinophytocola sp.]|uniref:TauD/TfdA family dioxygenase n=1 Tax=Actinophytocola sp. TaxID=1872138 RepID=UPI002D7FB578|nr:TauD/TfdA family dioxygenase [Actinophytocola sp.]HET9142983.1 TauD/TfdA family dioxygenase [Actinophytocola sp.]